MKFLLDANALIDLANESEFAGNIAVRLDAVGVRNCALSAVTVEELQFGVLTGPGAKKAYQVRNLKALLAKFAQLDFTPDAARRAAQARAALMIHKFARRERPPGVVAILLAGHAMAARRTLVTADFGLNAIKGVRLENWRTRIQGL